MDDKSESRAAKQPFSKPPKDGWGPRGVPDCYYTSRVLDSTARYVRYIKKLRFQEEDIRQGIENKLKVKKDTQILDFFTRNDRRGLINDIKYRVKLCLQEHDDELDRKRQRLVELFSAEEERDIRKFIEHVQTGTATAFQRKMDRLAHLLDKRQKEHQARYKEIPLDKCTHVHPCVVKLRAKEAQEIQLYQMREKQMRKMAEAEIDRMWYEVTMKEADALATRMEIDEMERIRRCKEQVHDTDVQVEERRQAREREREQLKKEVAEMKAQMAEADRKEEEKQQQIRNKTAEVLKDRDQMLKEHQEAVEKAKQDECKINEMWDKLAHERLAEQNAQIERRKKMELELDICNKRMVDMKHRIAEVKFNSDPMILEEGQRLQDAKDLVRCQTRNQMKRQRKEAQDYILKQIKDKKEDVIESVKARELEEYQRQVKVQLDELVKHKEMTDAQARHLYLKDLKDQMAYNDLLKERALQEELEQRKKCQKIKDEYKDTITDMLTRPFFSDQVHPFMQQMVKGPKMRWCPCVTDTYCKLSPEASKH